MVQSLHLICEMIESIDDLIVFLKHFHRNLLEDPSLPPEQIPDDLPEGLAKIYRELGKLVHLQPGPFASQDWLMPVHRLQRVYGTTKFCCENQYSWAACFPSGHKDPPVYLREMSNSQWEEDFVIVCDSLNHFLMTFCLQEAFMFGTRNSAWVNNVDNIFEAIKEKEKEQFQPLWLNGKYADADYLRNFYISEDRDMLIWNGHIGSQTRPLVDIFDPNINPKITVHMFGVSLPRRYWTKFSEWKAEWLLYEDNASIRQVLIEQLGYEEICDKLGAVLIDSWREYTLLKLDDMQIIYEGQKEVGREPMMLLKMTCPSTAGIHILRVPPEMTSAEAAITWVNHGIHPDRFAIQT
jgi:hypothetical protein